MAVNESNVIFLMHYKGDFEHHCQVGSPEETIGDTPLADIKNEVAKQFVLKMRTARLADKTIVNYFQVVRAVVESAVSSEGEQLYPRNWNFHFIGLPVVDEKKQCKPKRARAVTKCCLHSWQQLGFASARLSA